MDQTGKITLIAGCVAVLLFVLMALIGGLYLYRALRKTAGPPMGGRPAPAATPGIVTGEGLLSSSVFVQDGRPGTVTDVRMGELDPAPGDEIVVAGSRGALFLDTDGTVKSAVAFDARAAHVDAIDIEGDGVCEFMNRGSWGIPASVMDHQGKTMWTYGSGMPGVDDMASGDIDGDGSLEFAVGFNGGGGVHLVESDGTRVWRMADSNVWHVEMVDADGDGSLEIVHSNARGQMTVRDGRSNVVSQVQPEAYFSDFSLCRWPNERGTEHALLAEDDVVWLLDFSGKTAARLDAPGCGSQGEARGTLVTLRPDAPAYLAVVVDLRRQQRAVLYVYDSEGALVYQETRPEPGAAIAALALEGGPTEALLVGGQGRVVQYELAHDEE